MPDVAVFRRLDAPSSSTFRLMALATVISAIAYGFVITLYICCFRALLKGEEKYSTRKRQVLFIYISAMALLSTLALVQEASSSIFNVSILPEAFFTSSPSQSSTWILPFTIWGADGFKMWRCAALYYQGVSRTPRFFLACLLIFLGLISLGSGIILLASPFVPHRATLGFIATPIFIVFFSTVSNISLSILVTFRILYHQRKIRTAFGTSHGTLYTRIVIMCVESCALIVIPTVVYIILHFAQSKGSVIPLFLLPHLCVISPLLIVDRVIEGRDASTTLDLSEAVHRGFGGVELGIQFNDPGQLTSQSSTQFSHQLRSVEDRAQSYT